MFDIEEKIHNIKIDNNIVILLLSLPPAHRNEKRL